MGRSLAELGWSPDRLFTSDATRAVETARLLAKEAGAPEPDVVPELYLGGPHELAALALDGSTATVWVVGHSPGLDEAVKFLSGQTAVLKTADAALLTFAGAEDESWQTLLSRPASMELGRILRSRAVLDVVKVCDPTKDASIESDAS